MVGQRLQSIYGFQHLQIVLQGKIEMFDIALVIHWNNKIYFSQNRTTNCYIFLSFFSLIAYQTSWVN